MCLLAVPANSKFANDPIVSIIPILSYLAPMAVFNFLIAFFMLNVHEITSQETLRDYIKKKFSSNNKKDIIIIPTEQSEDITSSTAIHSLQDDDIRDNSMKLFASDAYRW